MKLFGKELNFNNNKVYHTGDKPTPSEIGAAAASHNHNILALKGTNTITSTSDDTTANWGAQGHSIHWYTTTGQLNNQPAQYGYILNFGQGSEVHQLWLTQASGNLAHRGGNGSGWSGTWRTILDSTNVGTYALPITGGTINGDLRIKLDSSNYGRTLYFGDGSYCYLREDTDDHLYIYASKGFNVKSSSSSYSLNLTGTTGLGDLTTNYSGMLVFGSGLQLNAGSSALSLLGGYVASYCDMSPGSNGGYSLGMSSYRWKEVYCTRGAFNGSDIRLKEDVKVISRNNNNTLKAKDKATVTSEELYDYVKNTNTYTFKYRNTDNENFIGVLANEIPDNIFSLIGRMSDESEESQKQVQDSLKAKEIYKVALKEGKYESMETMNTINEELGMSYAVIRDLAQRETDNEPMKLINAPAQVAMLQEVLSMAINKIEELETKVQTLESTN